MHHPPARAAGPRSGAARSPGASADPRPRDGFGPVLRGGRRRRPLRLALGVVGLLVVLVAGTAVALALVASLSMQREPVAGLGGGPGPTHVLVVGSDSREGLTDEELLALGTTAVAGHRADTVMLLSVQGGRAALLSFPRDLFVTLCDGSQGRLNAAHAIGGPSCLVQTVSGVAGVPVDHYVEMDFIGFWRVVDALGGVHLCLDEPMVDRPAGVDLPAGCSTLDGRQALGYVRARSIDSDLGRIERQQRFVRELARQVAEPATLVNVPGLFRAAGAAGGAVTADQGFGTVDLLRLAGAGRGIAAGIDTFTVPASPATVGGAAVLRPDPAAEALFASFRDGSALDEPAGPSP